MDAPAPSAGRLADLIGMANTVLCLVHCMAMPVLIAAGLSFAAHPSVTWAFIIIAFHAVRAATRRSHVRWMIVPMFIAWWIWPSPLKPRRRAWWLAWGFFIVV